MHISVTRIEVSHECCISSVINIALDARGKGTETVAMSIQVSVPRSKTPPVISTEVGICRIMCFTLVFALEFRPAIRALEYCLRHHFVYATDLTVARDRKVPAT